MFRFKGNSLPILYFHRKNKDILMNSVELKEMTRND